MVEKPKTGEEINVRVYSGYSEMEVIGLLNYLEKNWLANKPIAVTGTNITVRIKAIIMARTLVDNIGPHGYNVTISGFLE